MFFDWFARHAAQKESKKKLITARNTNNTMAFNYTWIITGRLAIGPIPRVNQDWILLENNGIKKRFSCCYTEEHNFAPIPTDWKSREVSLPDHRLQEQLTSEKLRFALNEAITLLNDDSQPIYLHCFAGQERSTLLATGIVSITENKDLFESLAFVRQCYPRARPLYEHLDILETILKNYNQT